MKPNQAQVRVLAGTTLDFAAVVHDAEEPGLTAAAGSWTLMPSGSEQPAYVVSGPGGTYSFPRRGAGMLSYSLAYTVADCQGAATTVTTLIQVYPWEGEMAMGLSSSEPARQTSVVQFTVRPADVGKYFHLATTAPSPLGAFVVRGDRNGGLGDYNQADDAQRMGVAGNPYQNPELEFKPPTPGTYTLVLVSTTAVDVAWLQPIVAPAGMIVHYSFSASHTSPAARHGKSVFIARDTFPASFVVDGQTVSRDDFDFDGLERSYNQVFRGFRWFMGSDVTKYGTMIGVMYPRDPNYGYCADASSPIDLACITMRTRGFYAFDHELAHVFTQAYPFEYFFQENGKGYGNTETLTLYLTGWTADPRGGGGSAVGPYLRNELMFLNNTPFAHSTHWNDVLGDAGFLFFLKNVSGGWHGVASVLRRYAAEWNGQDKSFWGDDRTRAGEFYRRLAASVPEDKREVFQSQLRAWNFPFANPALGYVDEDGDGIVQGLDPDDRDPLLNQYTEECADSRCVLDGVDNNQNGYVDEFILRDEETIRLGDDDTAYDVNRGTRRKLFLQAGTSVTVQAESGGKPVLIEAARGNLPIWQGGPLWWYDIQREAVVEATLDPVLTFQASTTGVYTFNFFGNANDGIPIGYPVKYRVIRSPE